MDRQIVYPGSIPLDTDLLGTERNVQTALGFALQGSLGNGTVADGLACTPTVPASLAVNIGPGSLTLNTATDTSQFGSLPAVADLVVKQGINTQATQFTLTAPTTSGQSINYLIQATFAEADASPVVLPYYNAANPAQPYSGPENTGVTQNTQRNQRVALQLKAGGPQNTGSQNTPSVDPGYSGLYVINVAYGQQAVTAANITTYSGAPFLPYKLPALGALMGGVLAALATLPAVFQSYSTAGGFNATVPPGKTQCLFLGWAGGAGGGGSYGTNSAGTGGGGGEFRVGIATNLTPGQVIAGTIGAGGAGGNNSSSPGNGGAGGNTALGSIFTAIGGGGGTLANGGVQAATGTNGGSGGSGGQYSHNGTPGGSGVAITTSSLLGGAGGASFFGSAPGPNVSSSGLAGIGPGGGGNGGSYGGPGGPGATGLVWLLFI